MEQVMVATAGQVGEGQWVTLPGGELEGRRPIVLCGPCRMRRAIGAERKAVCFECYKADARRQRAFESAASLDTGSTERLQSGLPFEAVDRPRLERLKGERVAARQQLRVGVGRFVDKRRHAQIAARRMGDLAPSRDRVMRRLGGDLIDKKYLRDSYSDVRAKF